MEVKIVNLADRMDCYFTEHKGYYEKFGWTFVEEAPKMNGEYTRIYRKSLTTTNGMER